MNGLRNIRRQVYVVRDTHVIVRDSLASQSFSPPHAIFYVELSVPLRGRFHVRGCSLWSYVRMPIAISPRGLSGCYEIPPLKI